MKLDPLGQRILNQAIDERDRAVAETKAAQLSLLQVQAVNADMIRLACALLRRLLGALDDPIEEVTFTFAELAEEGAIPSLRYRKDAPRERVTLRLTPFPTDAPPRLVIPEAP